MSATELIRKALRLIIAGDGQRVTRALKLRLRHMRRRFIRTTQFDYGQSDDIPSPIVSVIIPCFNYGRFLGEAVQSVLDRKSVV